MRIKEIRISDNGYEVTFVWTANEMQEMTHFAVLDFLARTEIPHIDFLDLIEKEIEIRKEKRKSS